MMLGWDSVYKWRFNNLVRYLSQTLDLYTAFTVMGENHCHHVNSQGDQSYVI